MKKRLISLSTVLVYWFAIVGGLALFTATRNDDIDLAGMWIGGIGGTALGQFLASRDVRLWIVGVILLAFVVLCGPFTPLHNGGMLFWMALIPGTLCGWLSLSDRGSLVAFWFPVCVWMLSILDRGQGALKLETGSAALLGSLAFVYIAFLYARETRRIGLWRTVAPTPIAPESVPVILKEVPRFRFGVAGWSLFVSSAAFGICAWLAPRLWHVEPLVPDLYATATERPDARAGGARCCQDIHINEQKRARVKEYFDIGRGHDDGVEEFQQSIEDCVVCDSAGVPMNVEHYGYGEGYTYGYGTSYGNGYGEGGYRGGAGYNSYGNYGNYYGNAPSYTTPSYTAPPEYSAPSYTPPSTYTPPTYTPPTPEVAPPTYTPPAYTPPVVEPEVTPPPRIVDEWKPPEPAKPEPTDPMPTEPEIVKPPPAVAAAPQPSTPKAAPTVAAPTTTAQQAPNAPTSTPPFLSWILFVVAGGFAFQMLLLGVRPVRRLVTLRHLRKPFWNETVDQRISNWWHLVLVGLRDAGWRTTTGEAPRELAKRLDIEGVERAAAILDRARHGVGIDQDDLSQMEEASEKAYRASRDRASAFARFLGWFRRPLV